MSAGPEQRGPGAERARAESPAQPGSGSWNRTYLPTSMQKSPRMVPGVASAGFVAPMSAREARTTSRPCHTCRRGPGSARGQRAALPPASTHHGHHRPGAHVLDQAPVERALTQLGVVLAQQLLGGLGREGGRDACSWDPHPPRAGTPSPPAPHPAALPTPGDLSPTPPSHSPRLGTPALTSTSFSATSLKPFLSKRRTISPTSRRCTPSGFTARKVRSCTPVYAVGTAGVGAHQTRSHPLPAPPSPRRSPAGKRLAKMVSTRQIMMAATGLGRLEGRGGGDARAGAGPVLKAAWSPGAATSADAERGCLSFTPTPGPLRPRL